MTETHDKNKVYSPKKQDNIQTRRHRRQTRQASVSTWRWKTKIHTHQGFWMCTTFLISGASIPSDNDEFPLFQITPSFRKISESGKIFPTFGNISQVFPPKITISSAKINFWWPFLVTRSDFLVSPYFGKNGTFSPCFRKLINLPSPILQNFPLISCNLPGFSIGLRVFRFPPTLTMMHLCIIQCSMHWTLLPDLPVTPKQDPNVAYIQHKSAFKIDSENRQAVLRTPQVKAE